MTAPLTRFWQLTPDGDRPRQATYDVGGTIPIAAARHCEAFRLASQQGWLLYPPMSFGLRWDGQNVFWTYDSGEGLGRTWELLADEVVYPGYVDFWNDNAPEYLRDYVPPFLALAEHVPGMVQIWTGAFCQTPPDWSLWVRGPVNESRTGKTLRVLEGIVAFDTYGGHLFANAKLMDHDSVFCFSKIPLLQVTPVNRTAPAHDFVVGAIGEMSERRWRAFEETVKRPIGDGRYGARERKAARSE